MKYNRQILNHGYAFLIVSSLTEDRAELAQDIAKIKNLYTLLDKFCIF